MEKEDNNNYKKLNGRVKAKNGVHKHLLQEAKTVTYFESTPKRPIGPESESSEEESTLAKRGRAPGFIFKYYKKFEEYWNVFPKTDYTYSRYSPFNGKQVAPGIPVVPNMSRRQIGSPYRNRYRERSRWERTRDVWTSFWWFVVRTVVTIVQTVTTIVTTTTTVTETTTTSQTPLGRSKARSGGTPYTCYRLLLLPLLLLIIAYLFRDSLVGLIAEERTEEEEVRSYGFLLTPLYSLAELCTSVLGLVLDSLTMIPTLLVQLASLVFSLIFYPLQWLGGTFQSAVKSHIESIHVSSMGGVSEGMVSLSEVRRIVGEMVEARLASLEGATITSSLASDKGTDDEALFSRLDGEMTRRTEEMFTRLRTEMDKAILKSGGTYNSTLFILLQKQREEWESVIYEMEKRMKELRETTLSSVQHSSNTLEVHKSTIIELRERLGKQEVLLNTIEAKIAQLKELESGGVSRWEGEMTQSDLKRYIDARMKVILAKYHADKTGLPDYALQSTGGYVVSIRCTVTYPIAGRQYLFGIPLWDTVTTPDTILKPGIMPGECWAFVGSEGYVIIKLAVKIRVTSFTMEHMPKELSIHGDISSAPQHFSVWSLTEENDPSPEHLGSFRFLDNGESLQSFVATDIDRGTEMIELKIESNHGHLEYTCLYRFRVHGVPFA